MATKAPNILFIHTDQLTAEMLGAYGNKLPAPRTLMP